MEQFTEEQTNAYNDFIEGKNIFISGSGGCGKSYFIKQIYDITKESNIKKIQVVSTTGCSAILLNCDATTIHRWASIGIGTRQPEEYIRTISRNKESRKRYIETDILVIDEVSMLSEKVFDLIDIIAKTIRKNDLPFGGIQLILSGDFFQLPPVCTDKTDVKSSRFCFMSEQWNETINSTHLFTRSFRQQNDQLYYNILQDIRVGKVSLDITNILCERVGLPYDDDNIKPTKLYPLKNKVVQINNEELNKLDTSSVKYEIMFTYGTTQYRNYDEIQNKKVANDLEFYIKNCKFEDTLLLKEGSQVMYIVNNSELNLVNGSQGIVVGFQHNKPLVLFNGMDTPILITEYEQTIEHPSLPNSCKDKSTTITQIPLILSWAVTIHKAQGISIDKAVIDIGRNVFEYGQTYVALSRVRSLEGLYLTSYRPQNIRANPKVIQFYNNIING